MADTQTRPAILAVDDDAQVLRAVERDLRRRFGGEHRIVRADSGARALDVLRELRRRGDAVALVLADQRMPAMTGVELLTETRELYPEAKRVLLTAYADTDAAIAAINEASLDYYLLKPWDPPEERLYPVLEDLLGDWRASAALGRSQLRVIGHRFSQESHAVRDFLARNLVPFRWLDADQDAEARELLALADVDAGRLPVVLLVDGTVLEAPTPLELAGRLGLTTEATLPFYDLVIVGGGPAGLGAAVYGASEGLKTVLVEREAPGGQAGQSSLIENYLGFPNGLSGSDLARRATTQARRFGAEIVSVREVEGLDERGAARVLRLGGGGELAAHTVLIATGVSYRMLDAPGMAELTGRGIYYGAAMTEALSCRDQHVAIVGGANSAGQAAMYFSRFARKVTMLVRADDLGKSMSHYLVAQIERTPNIEVRTGTTVAGVTGTDHVEGVLTEPGGELDATAMFVFIGAAPRTDWVGASVARDERGFILSGRDVTALGDTRWPLERDPFLLETSLPGVFVAGDVRHRSVKRVASAVGEGSMAVQFIHQYLAVQ